WPPSATRHGPPTQSTSPTRSTRASPRWKRTAPTSMPSPKARWAPTPTRSCVAPPETPAPAWVSPWRSRSRWSRCDGGRIGRFDGHHASHLVSEVRYDGGGVNLAVKNGGTGVAGAPSGWRRHVRRFAGVATAAVSLLGVACQPPEGSGYERQVGPFTIGV